jgi:DHA1 family solute carrier family 18 vesicular amine transporter 1/2
MNENMSSFAGPSGAASRDFTCASLRAQFADLVSRCRQSRNLVLVVVFIALFFDNMLLTTVVPIIPDYLFSLEHPNASQEIAALLGAKNLSAPASGHFSAVDALLTQERLSEEKERWKSVQMNKLSAKVSLMFASKPVVQLITNPLIGPLTNR